MTDLGGQERVPGALLEETLLQGMRDDFERVRLGVTALIEVLRGNTLETPPGYDYYAEAAERVADQEVSGRRVTARDVQLGAIAGVRTIAGETVRFTRQGWGFEIVPPDAEPTA